MELLRPRNFCISLVKSKVSLKGIETTLEAYLVSTRFRSINFAEHQVLKYPSCKKVFFFLFDAFDSRTKLLIHGKTIHHPCYLKPDKVFVVLFFVSSYNQNLIGKAIIEGDRKRVKYDLFQTD